ncbi:pre-rRNA processing [Neonectria punicea]|uniref:Pre-rRNA processing n=1 Tax=Neonectria punicea TaxID=979145 RepID=A0ABR1GZ81_9HYPO
MADFDDAALSPEDEEQLWAELDRCVSTHCDSHETIDDALRCWLDLATQLRDRLPDSEDDIAACARMLLASDIFCPNKEYVRTQIIYSLLQEDETGPLHAITCFLLLDGFQDEATFPRMVREACFPRLLELINGRQHIDPRLHRHLLHLMYEMSRIERLRVEDLVQVDDGFVYYLFCLIEELSDDAHDPYHYPTIRVLLVLNEQYMLASTDSVPDPSSPNSPPNSPLTNRIVKCLSIHGPSFRTFGENIILLLNRETETSLQLLILKLLYLLFTNRATYEYFYTNDLRVLLDVIIRNLMDLPDEKMSLRHTYLRVLYPLLAHTQLSQPPYYKQDEIFRVLNVYRGSQNAHFAPADETTLRLVERVAKVKWVEEAGQGSPSSPRSGEAEVARKILGISLSHSESSSSISVGDVAAVMEKPGVQTPSRAGEADADGDDTEASEEGVTMAVRAKKPLPAVPKHRHGIPFAPAARLHMNGAPKKTPPKAPPPRRFGRMKTVEHPPADPIRDTVPEQEA